jgi:hypothetical protein
METESESRRSLAPGRQEVATAFRLTGWISFWIQLGLIAVSGIALLFAITGRNVSKGTSAGIGFGIFWAVSGILVLGCSVYLAFRYTRIGKSLRNPKAEHIPKKADTIQILRLGLIVGLVGLLLNLLGAGATVGVLVAKSVSQPPGVAITDPNKIVRALDVFVEVANINGIAAHFVGIIAALWLLDKAHRH